MLWTKESFKNRSFTCLKMRRLCVGKFINESIVLSVLKINEMDKFLPLLLEMVRWENTVEEGVDKLTKGMVVANTEGAS